MKLTFNPKSDNVQYMYRGNSTRIVPIILVLVVIAVLIAALVSIGRTIFGGNTSQNTGVDAGRTALLDTSANHSVRMIVRGPIVANEQFHSYQITVNSSSRKISTYKGYLDQPITSKIYGNNLKAYEQFVYALDKANYMSADELEGDKNDTRGICATGLVYEFSVIDGDKVVKKLWTSTCKGSPGSLKASVSQVGDLFRAQIPGADDILRGLGLGTGFQLSF